MPLDWSMTSDQMLYLQALASPGLTLAGWMTSLRLRKKVGLSSLLSCRFVIISPAYAAEGGSLWDRPPTTRAPQNVCLGGPESLNSPCQPIDTDGASQHKQQSPAGCHFERGISLCLPVLLVASKSMAKYTGEDVPCYWPELSSSSH